MQLKQLQFFVVSVDRGSFKAASEVLYTSQPHISKTIKALEEELDFPLLNRKAKGVVMTEEGRKVYEYAAGILRNMEMIGMVQEEKDPIILLCRRVLAPVCPGCIRSFMPEIWRKISDFSIWKVR